MRQGSWKRAKERRKGIKDKRTEKGKEREGEGEKKRMHGKSRTGINAYSLKS